MISSEDQTVKVGEKEFSFKTYESIEVFYSKRWLERDISELMEVAGAKLIGFFTDKRKYYGEFLYEK